AVAAQPAESVLDVVDDGRQLHLGGQAIIEGDQDVALFLAQLEKVPGHAGAAADDEGAAVQPDHARADLGVGAAVDVGVDGELVHCLEDVRRLGERRPGGRGRSDDEHDERREATGHVLLRPSRCHLTLTGTSTKNPNWPGTIMALLTKLPWFTTFS